MTKEIKNSKDKKKKIKDPYLTRESETYTKPIYSREFIIDFLIKRKLPATLTDLIVEFDLQEDDDRKEALRRRTRAMIRDNQLERMRKGKMWPSHCRKLVQGKVVFDKKNNAWLQPGSDKELNKIELIDSDRFVLFPDQKIIASVLEIPGEEQFTGKIIDILDHPETNITGKFVEDFDFNYVIARNKYIKQHIVIPNGKENSATDGQIVTVDLLEHGNSLVKPKGVVIEVLGGEGIAGIEIESAIRMYDLPHVWPVEVQTEVQNFTREISNHSKKNRIDLSDLPFVTIDGVDARDFDDAVYCCKRKEGGWRLYVAIADVSYYVKPGMALNKEAESRGNSVYFPNQVIPMLPEILSNELCSLKPNVERLAMICEMLINENGIVTKSKFYEAIIKSKARLTYAQVAEFLENTSNTVIKSNIPKFLHSDLRELHNLYEILHDARAKRGAIDFETVETRIIFGKKRTITKIVPVERNVAHKIIEECMLSANVATAKFLNRNKVAGIYRVHEEPLLEKMQDLKTFLSALGLSLGMNKRPTPMDYGQLLKKIKNRKDANIIQTVLLRSLSQAVYSPENVGHFGLAYTAYTHFTSPIRRYPDLLVHRIIKQIIEGKAVEKNEKSIKKIENIAHHCSVTERRADEAVREVERYLKCKYMSSFIGNIFTGVISGVTRFGFFVELNDIFIDGLVHVNSLRDDYYNYDQIHHNLTGTRTGKIYSLGDQLSVILTNVSIDEKRIDLDLVEDKKNGKTNKKQKIKKEPTVFKKDKPKSKSKSKSKLKNKSKTKQK